MLSNLLEDFQRFIHIESEDKRLLSEVGLEELNRLTTTNSGIKSVIMVEPKDKGVVK